MAPVGIFSFLVLDEPPVLVAFADGAKVEPVPQGEIVHGGLDPQRDVFAPAVAQYVVRLTVIVNYPSTKDGWACSTTRKTVLGALGLLTEAPLGWLIASK